ncbi:unnamed protein product, partial [Allacma fusca]
EHFDGGIVSLVWERSN